MKLKNNLIKVISQLLEKFKIYNKIVGIEGIARRYFILNSFDGILITMGIILGAFIGGVKSARFIISAVIGGAIAMCVSGIFGAYLSEGAERERELKELERQTLTKLRNTEIGKAQKVAVFFIAFIDGVSPAIASLIILIPFFFYEIIAVRLACIISILISLFILFVLGAYLGRISKQNIYMLSLKMIVAGLVCIILNYILLK